ncbi:MAG: hypothetical protein GWO81_05525 [Verrucomicrobia bacterium]|nr:hypothetical protein [Verrucomicrobiota bacterium]
MNKFTNLLLIAAFMSATLAVFFTGTSFERKSHRTLEIAQQINLALQLAAESRRPLNSEQRIYNDKMIDQLIIIAAEQRADWWLKPCSRKTLNLALLKAFQYRGVDPALASLKREMKDSQSSSYRVSQCKQSIQLTEAAYAKLSTDPAYDPLIRDLICKHEAVAKPQAAPEPMALELPPIPDDFDNP